MSADRAEISAIVLTAMGDAWSDSEEYSALPGVSADLLLVSDWLAEHDRQVAERAWDEGSRAAAAENVARDLWEDGDQIENPYRKAQ